LFLERAGRRLGGGGVFGVKVIILTDVYDTVMRGERGKGGFWTFMRYLKHFFFSFLSFVTPPQTSVLSDEFGGLTSSVASRPVRPRRSEDDEGRDRQDNLMANVIWKNKSKEYYSVVIVVAVSKSEIRKVLV